MNGPDGRRFPWGRIVQTHEIGEYQIVEAVWNTPNIPDRHGKTWFHAYINGENTHTGAGSLDSALIVAIAYKREGPNGKAARYFNLMTLGKIPEGME